MPTNLTMPSLSPTMEEGTLASWLIAEGDTVRAGDVLAEIETDKATMEFESPESGILASIVVAAGTEAVPVDTLIAVLVDESEDPASVANVTLDHASTEPEPTSQSHTDAPPRRTPPNPAKEEGDRIFASPLARRLAQETGVDLRGIGGSGPRGRIVRADVEEAASSLAGDAETSPATHEAPSKAELSSAYGDRAHEVVELDTMRKTIARRLTESKQTVPHFYLRTEIEIDALLSLRAEINGAAIGDEDARPSFKISVNDLVIKALALAMRDNPDANVTWAGGSMLRHRSVDIAVAVSIDGGLITPVVRDAQALSISSLSNIMKDLAARARDRKLAPHEYQGGSTSVSNLGMFGVSSFDAVISPPHGTILAVGAGEKRPVVRGDEIAIATVMTATLSVDHRVVDGALGAEVLASVKSYLENPMTLLV